MPALGPSLIASIGHQANHYITRHRAIKRITTQPEANWLHARICQPARAAPPPMDGRSGAAGSALWADRASIGRQAGQNVYLGALFGSVLGIMPLSVCATCMCNRTVASPKAQIRSARPAGCADRRRSPLGPAHYGAQQGVPLAPLSTHG